jgi:hypothetical protein
MRRYICKILSTLLHVYMFLHNLLNALVQIANKMGLQKKIYLIITLETSRHLNIPYYMMYEV